VPQTGSVYHMAQPLGVRAHRRHGSSFWSLGFVILELE
jgi:hypothetical protein